jgi:hemerythrin-like metal-binding protein
MNSIEWSERFSVGVAELDAQHRRLIAIINRLLESAELKLESEILSDTFNELTQYALEHFRLEEQMMRAVGYPDLEAHQNAHESFLVRVAELGMETWSGHTEVPAALVTLLTDWLQDHLLKVDMAYKPHLAARPRD